MSGLREKLKAGSITKGAALELLGKFRVNNPWDAKRIKRIERWVINFKQGRSKDKVVGKKNKRGSRKARF